MFLTDLFDRFKGVFEKNIFTVHHVLFFTEDIHVCAFDTDSLRQNLKKTKSYFSLNSILSFVLLNPLQKVDINKVLNVGNIFNIEYFICA